MVNQLELRKHPRFKGRFFTFRAQIYIDQDNRSKASFLVFSSGKREAVMDYLWSKHVWDQLTKIEYELFILTLGPTEFKKWNFLKLQIEFSKLDLRKSLTETEHRLGTKETNRERYLGIKHLNIEIQREIRILPKTKKFSGYIKSLAQRGKSSSTEKGIEPLSPDPLEYFVQEDQDLLWERWLRPSLD